MLEDKSPALNSSNSLQVVCDNLNAMHATRQQFIKFESCEKVKRALRHNIKGTDADSVQSGDNVFYKRRNDYQWHGPGTHYHRFRGRSGHIRSSKTFEPCGSRKFGVA